MEGLVAAHRYVILRRLLSHRLSPEMRQQVQDEMDECRDEIRALVRKGNDAAMMRRSQEGDGRGNFPWLQIVILIAIMAILAGSLLRFLVR